MNKVVLAAATLACSAAISADDFTKLTISCIGLDDAGLDRCMGIIARHEYGALPNMHAFTLAEKTAVNAVMAADPKAVVVILADGSFVIGHTVGDRLIGIPCQSNFFIL
jgi:hypothetical protein